MGGPVEWLRSRKRAVRASVPFRTMSVGTLTLTMIGVISVLLAPLVWPF